MIHKKLLSLLVLLMTVASGAWAQTQWTSGSCTVTLNNGTLTVSGNGAMADYQLSSDQPWYNNRNDITSVVVESGVTTVGRLAFYYFGNMTSVTLPEGLTSIGSDAFYQCASVTDVNLYADPANLTWNEDGCDDFNRNVMGSTQCHVLAEHLSAYQTKFSDKVNVTFVGDLEPLPSTVTLNDTKTEATFAMPDFDATANYEIVRDLAQQTSVNLIIGTGDAATPVTADTRLRIQKVNNVYAPVSALSCTFTDAIENKTILPTGFDDAKLTPLFYKQGENDAWTLVTDINTTTKLPNNLQPGQVYYITLKAADGSYYDGETPQSFTVTLFEGYEVAVPAGEYVTFYKDEPLYADPVSSTDAVLYTISSVSTTDGTATLSDAINVAPKETPLLVYNAGNTDATFLLIPADAEPNLALTVAPEFIGTLEATTIAASTSTKNNYAFNGLQFVWVKNAVEIGANKAWLAISSGELQARTITLVFDETTKIANTNVTNITNGDWYDLNGRKLDKMPTKKGVYIFNGRKVVIK